MKNKPSVSKLTKLELQREANAYRAIAPLFDKLTQEKADLKRTLDSLREDLKRMRESRDEATRIMIEQSEKNHAKIAMYERWLQLEEARAGILPPVAERASGGYATT